MSGYVPFPVPYPVYPSYPSWPAKTAQGVGYVRWAILFATVMQAINSVGFAWVAVVLTGAASSGLGFASSFEVFGANLAFICAAGIIAFAAVIFFILGASSAHEGREEFGPDHAREMDRAVIFLIIAFVMGVIASAGGLGSASFGVTPFGFQGPFSPVGGVFGTVRGLFVGLLLGSLVRVFISKEDCDITRIGTALLTISPAIGTGIAFLTLTTNPVDPLTVPALAPLAFWAAAALSGVELIAFVLFFRVYSSVLRRMRAGELPPIPRPPPLYAPYYPGLAYYPVYPGVPEGPPPIGPPPAQPPP